MTLIMKVNRQGQVNYFCVSRILDLRNIEIGTKSVWDYMPQT